MRTVRCGLPLLVMLVTVWPGSAAQSSTFQDLFAQYRGTQAEEAIRAFALWDDRRVAAEANLSPWQLQDPWAAAALALFHLEADLHRQLVEKDLRTGPSSPGGVLRLPGHIFIGQALLEAEIIPMAKRRGDRDLLAFCRDWYIVRDTAWSGPRSSSGWELTESARRHLAEDPEIQMLAGLEASRLMGPSEQGDSPYSFGSFNSASTKHGLISAAGRVYDAGYARDAELAFKRALALLPSLAEAYLRLGRLYQVLGRRKDAEAELVRARATAGGEDRLTAYLSNLFLGELHEEAGRKQEAEHAYRAAVKIHPGGTSARLALGDLLFTSGHADDAWTMTRSSMGPETSSSLRDPWALYRSFGYWQLGPRLAGMRRRASETPVTTVSPALVREVAAAPALAAPPSQPVSKVPVFRSGVEGVRVDVSVSDGDRPVEHLAASDFVVTDNGVRQTVARSTTAGSLSLALVLDASSSLNSAAGHEFLTKATEAIRRGLLGVDVVSVVTAADRFRSYADSIPGSGLSSMLAMTRPRLDDFTALWDAVLAASSLAVDVPGRGFVVVVSDGADNASWFARSRAIDRLKRRGLAVDGISVPWVDVRGAWDIAYGDINLRDSALATGGVAFDVRDPDLNKKIADRFAALRQSYLLMYTPTDVKPQKDGWHEIKVTLRPGLKGKVQARPGYYAPIGK